MQRLCSILLAGCFLFNTVSVSSFAQGTNSRRNCDVHAMLNSSDNEQWSNANCLKAVTSYLSKKSSAQVKQECGNVCSTVSNRLAMHIKTLLKQGKEHQARVYEDLVNAFNKAANLSFNRECVDVHGKTVPCTESNGIHDKVTKKMKPKVPPNQTSPNPGESGNTTIVGSVNFCFGEGASDPDLTNKIARLAAMDKDALYDALTILVMGGSARPKDPAYVHPVILNVAFFLYAKKITAAEQGNIEQYLNPREVDSGIDSKYASNVQLAAANALSSFAKTNPNAIEPKFSLSSYATVKEILSASGLIVGAASVTVSLSLWDVLAAELAAAGGEIAASVAEFTAAMKAAAASAANAGTAVVSSAPLGATVVFVAGAACFVYALNDAYSAGYKAAFNRARETFWTEVFAPEVDTSREIYPLDEVEPEEAVMSFVTVWTPAMAKLGDLTATATQTKQRKKPTCQYVESPAGEEWMLNKLEEFINRGDPRSKERLNYLRECLGRYSLCPAKVEDPRHPFNKCDPISLSSIGGGSFPCYGDLQQLKRVHQVASSFYAADSGHKLFTRAIYKENIQFKGGVQITGGRWIPEAEIGISFKNSIEDIGRIFIQEIQDVIKQQLYGSIENISNTFSLGNYRSFRRGDHERNTKSYWDYQKKFFDKKQTYDDTPYQHFHYEEFLTYPTKNPYICNHSIYYPANL